MLLQKAASPESLGISSAGILSFLDALKASGGEIHGLLLLRHGQIASEMAFSPYGNDTPHMLFSLTKSFTSTGIGFAISEGKLTLDTKVADVLSDKLPENPSEALQAITVAHLLCMGSGLDPKSDSRPKEKDWARHALSFPVVHTPGTVFHYNSMGSHLLSEMLQRVTGETLLDYLMPRLFTPLGIAKPQWGTTPTGVNTGGWGLFLSTRDIALFGQLLLQKGVWEGRQLLPKGWTELATQKHIENNGESPDWHQGYCFQFWRCRENCFRGDGMYGQMCWVAPELDAVIAITAGLDDMGAEAELLVKHLLPAIGAPASDTNTQSALTARLGTLGYPFPENDGTAEKQIAGQYAAENGQILGIHFHGDTLALHCMAPEENDDSLYIFHCGLGAPIQATYANPANGEEYPYLGTYGWRDGTMHIAIRTPSTPYIRKSVIALTGDGVTETVDSIGFGNGVTRYQRVANAE